MKRIINKEIQNESHDWLGDSAESLVRYYFAKKGYCVYGSGKWGADCVLQDRKTGKMLTVEVKSSDSKGSDGRIRAKLKRSLMEKLKKMEAKVRPDLYAEVRLKKRAEDTQESRETNDISIQIWGINKAKMSLVDPAKILKLLSHSN